ncbi:MAG: nuclear transport factor 2 family protein [Oscillospiraceae bacterium]|nr:nuclear transport factor 2 family protein [Oscillospiraceae bacterium]
MTEIIRKYFQAWIDADIETVKEIFSNDVIYNECYGPEYHGLSQIIQWFNEWNKKGKVLEWTIKQTIEHNKSIIVEWYFKCNYDGNTDGFDGVTIADFDNNNKIISLREFQSKAEHYFPYGE